MKNLTERFPYFIGFNDVFKQLDTMLDGVGKETHWPPYNIVKTGDRSYKIELAVAGFAKSDIEVMLDGNKLVVKGATETKDAAQYLYKGIADRSFSRVFTLADGVEVKGAEMVNGFLEVVLEQQVKACEAIKKISVK